MIKTNDMFDLSTICRRSLVPTEDVNFLKARHRVGGLGSLMFFLGFEVLWTMACSGSIYEDTSLHKKM